jgi:DNA-binding MarR family transcriptional regulator
MRLRAAYAFFRRRSGAALAPVGISSDQFVLLTVLAHNGPATQQQLVEKCYSDTVTLGSMLALLEKRGLIRRKAHAKDGRAWMVSLTAAGSDLQKESWNQSESIRTSLAKLYSPEEAAILFQLLDRAIETMKPRRKRARTQSVSSPNGIHQSKRPSILEQCLKI